MVNEVPENVVVTLLVVALWSPSSRTPRTYAVAATTSSVTSTKPITESSLATSSRVRPTGRIST